jgi:LemA protein
MHTVWILGGALFLFALWMFEVDDRWIVAGGLALLAWSFNSVVAARNAVDKAFASVSVMLKKRFDLVPNLVDSVQRYVEHESEVLEEVTRLRAEAGASALSPEQASDLDGRLDRALARLLATAEGYPDLKASENFQQLQRALNEVEEQISAARRTYNAAVKHYDDALHMFPTNVLARLAGFTARPYFEIPEGHDAPPAVGARFRAGRNA